MNYASVCDGIGAAHCAWEPLCWHCAWTSEIEPFPIAVVDHHWQLPNLGDMTRITDAQLEQHGRIRLLVGGTPCQSFSVAGLRKGLADPRGNLALGFLGLVDRTRPEWVVWENVPGVLSSNKGRDFGSFLGALGELGYGFAYSVLDAQYFGLAQRRKRVFVVGCAGDWRRAAAVLFERASLSGNPAPRRETRARIASSPTQGLGSGGADAARAQANWPIESPDVSVTLCASGAQSLDPELEPLIAHTLRAEGFDASEDGTGRGTPIVPVAFTDLRGRGSEIRVNGDCAEALHCAKGMSEQQAVAMCVSNDSSPVWLEECSTPIRVGTGIDLPASPSVTRPTGVRRLTPRECEKLQGFPTRIDRVIIDACSEHQSNAVAVAVKCLRSHSNAFPADDGESVEPVEFADSRLWNDRASRESLVAVHVRTGFAPRAVAIRSRGKWLWSADGAAGGKWFLPHMPADVFARGIAAAVQGLAHAVRNGKAASPPNTRSFTLPANGRWLAGMFGRANAAAANDAHFAHGEAMRFITSNLGRDTKPCDLTETIWLSFVMDAISLCIPKETRPASSVRFVLDNETDYTAITYKGKPAADGPRYRALGNSMAVPVMRWIGERIQMMEERRAV